MNLTDPIADMLTRIRNAAKQKHATVDVPYSKVKAEISNILLNEGFIAPSINIETVDPLAEGLPIVTEKKDIDLDCVMSNSFGFGGTNASLVFSKYKA